MDGPDSDVQKQSTADMTAFVQNLLEQMQSRFQTMSESIITKNCDFLDKMVRALDEMGNRIDELEKSVNDLRTEVGIEGSPSPVAPKKTNSAEGSG